MQSSNLLGVEPVTQLKQQCFPCRAQLAALQVCRSGSDWRAERGGCQASPRPPLGIMLGDQFMRAQNKSVCPCRMGFRCLWDKNTDDWAQYTFTNVSLPCAAAEAAYTLLADMPLKKATAAAGEHLLCGSCVWRLPLLTLCPVTHGDSRCLTHVSGSEQSRVYCSLSWRREGLPCQNSMVSGRTR